MYVLFDQLSERLPTFSAQLNPSVNQFQRSFVGEIRRIEEMARRVRFFAAQIALEKDAIRIRPLNECVPLSAHSLDELDVTLSEYETRLLQMNESYQTLSHRTREFSEARHVLRETAVFFDKVRMREIDHLIHPAPEC